MISLGQTQPGKLTLHFVRNWRSFLPSLSLETHRKKAISPRDGRGFLSSVRVHPSTVFTRLILSSVTLSTRHSYPLINCHLYLRTLKLHLLIAQTFRATFCKIDYCKLQEDQNELFTGPSRPPFKNWSYQGHPGSG